MIKSTSTVITKTVKLPPASAKREHYRPEPALDLASFKMDLEAMMQDMIKSYLTKSGVIPKANPPQSGSQFISVDNETPQVPEPSEGEHSDFEQEDPDSRTHELDHLVPTAEEQLDYDSFALASPSVTRAPC